MLRRALGAGCFLLVTSAAHAQTIVTPPVEHGAGDVVVLKDGTVLHGTVREMTPGQALTVTLADGQSRTLEWNAIERVDIDRAKTAVASQAPQAPQPATARVHVDGAPPSASIQMLDEQRTGAWTPVCSGACDRELATNGLYRVDGPGIRASRPFRVEARTTRLAVSTASGAGFAGGLTLLIVGGAALVNGLGFFLGEALLRSEGFQGDDNFLIAGGVLCAVAIPMMIGGVVWMRANGHTMVSGATTVRVPAWRDAPTQPSSPSTHFARVTFPVLGGTF